MPSAENAPPQSSNREFYLRLGQLIMAFALAWLILSATVKVTDTIMVLAIFFGIAGLMMIIASRQMPKEAYIFSVLKKIMFPLMISVAALMVSAVMVGIPLLSFAAYLGNLPLIFVMTLALEAII
jgi:hypothetical protein